MSQIGPGQNPYGPAPMGPQQGGYPQPVVYRPGVPNVPMAGYGPADAYRPGMPPRGPMMAGAPGQPVAEKPKEYIAQKDVAFGIAGAVGGYFLAGMVGLSGPMGALILGIALLAISAGMRAFKKDDAPQQPINNQMPRPPVYPQPGQQQPMYQNRYNYQNEQMPGQPPRYPQ